MNPRIDRMFKAFADGTRLRILHLLSKEKELCVCDIMAAMEAPQSKVSRHLAYLKSAGLVHDHKEGLWRYYALSKPAGRFQRRIVECLGQCFDEVDILRRDGQRLDRVKKRGRRCA